MTPSLRLASLVAALPLALSAGPALAASSWPLSTDSPVHNAPAQPGSKVAGQLFTDYRVPTPVGPQAFEISRSWLAGSHRFDSVWSGVIAVNSVPLSTLNSAQKTQLEPHDMVLQLGFLQADNLIPNSKLQMGLVWLPWTDFEQGYWGYRMLGNSPAAGGIAGNTSYIPSWDYGLRLSGSAGAFRYAGAVFNGEGYRANETDGQKAFQGVLDYSPIDGLDVIAFGDRGNLAGTQETDRGALMLGYRTASWRAALEGTEMLDQNLAGSITHGQILTAYTVIGLPTPGVPTDLILRADQITPEVTTPDTNRLEAIAGIGFKVTKGLTLVVDDQNVTYNTPSKTTNVNSVLLNSSLLF